MKIKRVCIAIAAALLVSTVGFSLSGCGDPLDVYVKARADYSNGLYLEAAKQFKSLGDYRDSKEMLAKIYNKYLMYYGADSYILGDLQSRSKIYAYDYDHDRYNINAQVPDQYTICYKQYTTEKENTYEKTMPYTISDDGYINVMGGYSKHFSKIISSDKNEKENIYLILYKDFIIESSAIFNGEISEEQINRTTFSASFNRGYENYTFYDDGTFFYTGEDYRVNSINFYSGIYVRYGDFIFLNHGSGYTRGLLIYKNTIVDRCMIDETWVNYYYK